MTTVTPTSSLGQAPVAAPAGVALTNQSDAAAHATRTAVAAVLVTRSVVMRSRPHR